MQNKNPISKDSFGSPLNLRRSFDDRANEQNYRSRINLTSL